MKDFIPLSIFFAERRIIGMIYSIIVPVYNVELYIERCINSILKQTYNQFELILVDDGSTDQSKQICYDARQRDNRVKVMCQDNKGASAARNKGIENAKGEYILFLDGDDFWLHDNILEQINQRMQKKKSDVLIYNYAKVVDYKISFPYFEKEDMPVKYRGKASFQYIYDNDLWTSSAWNKAINKRLFENDELRFIEGITAEDIEWCARVLKKAESLDYINLVAVGYVQRIGSVTSNVTREKIRSLERSVLEVKSILKDAVDIKKNILQRFMAYQVVVLLINLSGADSEEQKKTLKKKNIRDLFVYLKYADNKKIKLLGKVSTFLSPKILIEMIGILRKVEKVKK